MKFIIPAFIVGALLNLLLFMPETGAEIRAQWCGSVKNPETIEKSADHGFAKTRLFLRDADRMVHLKGTGEIESIINLSDMLFSPSGNGNYYAVYRKTGTEIELLNRNGDRFWKIKSLEYPYLSYNGKLVFLMSADQNRLRILDYNGNEIGRKEVFGRFCTAVAFSQEGDSGCAGFLDGSFYFISEKGLVLFAGELPGQQMVKGIAVSRDGGFGAVHYGGMEQDHLAVINLTSKDVHTIPLKHAHVVKTAIHVSDNGHATIHDIDSILHVSDDAGLEFSIKVEPKRPGFSEITCDRGLYAASYTLENGEAKVILFNDEGKIFFSKQFPTESFMKAVIKENLILLQGSDTLYCYSVHQR